MLGLIPMALGGLFGLFGGGSKKQETPPPPFPDLRVRRKSEEAGQTKEDIYRQLAEEAELQQMRAKPSFMRQIGSQFAGRTPILRQYMDYRKKKEAEQDYED